MGPKWYPSGIPSGSQVVPDSAQAVPRWDSCVKQVALNSPYIYHHGTNIHRIPWLVFRGEHALLTISPLSLGLLLLPLDGERVAALLTNSTSEQ